MKIKIIILFICVNIFTSFSQSVSINIENKTKNEFSKNVVGLDAGVLFAFVAGSVSSSVNYERFIYKRDDYFTTLSVGTGYYILAGNDTGYGGIQIPVKYSIIYGKKNHFEIDLGGRAVFDVKNDGIDYSDEKMRVFPIINIGYRYQKPNSGFIFKSLIGLDGITLGIGYAF